MCYASRVWRREAVNEGIIEGIKKGKEEGKKEGKKEGIVEGMEKKTSIIFRNAVKLGLPQKSIQSLLNISADEYRRLLAL